MLSMNPQLSGYEEPLVELIACTPCAFFFLEVIQRSSGHNYFGDGANSTMNLERERALFLFLTIC